MENNEPDLSIESLGRQARLKREKFKQKPTPTNCLPKVREICMKVAIYARVSTEEQTTENQVPVLQEFAERRGWEVVKIYTEEASAWRAGHQKQLKELLTRASYHEYDIVLVWSLDRLTRQGIGSIMQLVSTLKGYGCQVISQQESWTLQNDGMMSDLLYSLFAWVAEFESKRRSERIKAALARKRAKGETIGRKPGAKDKMPRKRMGYFGRYNDRRK